MCTKETSFLDNVNSLLISISGQNDMLWFVTCLFVAQLIVFLYTELLCDVKIQVLVSVCLLVLGGQITNHYPWHIEIAFVAQFFVFLGMLSRKYNVYDKVKELNAYLIVLVYLILICFDQLMWNSFFDMHMGRYGNSVIYYSVLAILGIIILVKYQSYLPKLNILAAIGRNSLFFYAFQFSIIISLQHIFERIGLEAIFMKNTFTRCCATICYFSATIFCLYILLVIWDKIRSLIKVLNVGGGNDEHEK